MITLRDADLDDLSQLLRFNRQLIIDEGSRNPMTDAELGDRMRGWISSGEYRAVLILAPAIVGYALFREEPGHVHLRQFFVAREHRRRGIGRAALARLREEIWPAESRLTVDVLTANPAGLSFWRSMGFREYALSLDIARNAPARSTLGLVRHTVRVVEHDPAWMDYGAGRSRLLAEACGLGAEQVQHAGSTSVSGLPAKPIIDIVIGLRNHDEMGPLRGAMITLGYEDRGLKEGSVGHLFVRNSAPDVRVEHVHVVSFGGAHWKHYVTFRDRLRADPFLRDQYAALKRDLHARFPQDRAAYTRGKSEFIGSVLGEANR